MFKDLVKKARSIRRFDNSYKIEDELLIDIIDTARLTPSAANRQPIKFLVSNKKEYNDMIFPHLGWAAYLIDWQGPTPEEQPSAYIILYTDKQFVPHISCDIGIIAQTIQLALSEQHLGACIIASFEKNKIKRNLHLTDDQEVLLIIAIGKPMETVVLEEISEDESIKYWRDDCNVHHVPKRKLSNILRVL